MKINAGQYGSFNKEKDGRLSGTVLFVHEIRKDGKYPVTYAFGTSGKRIKKLISAEKLQEEIERIQNKEGL